MKRLLLFLLLSGMAVAQYPVSDPITGTGSLGANWTCASSAGATISKGSGNVTASGSGWAQCYWSANTFNNFGVYDEISVWKTPSTGTDTSAGPAVRLNGSGSGSGTGYVWQLGTHGFGILAGGFVNTGFGAGCPIPSAGDIVAAYAVGSTLTCVDVTTNGGSYVCTSGSSSCGTATDTTYTTGSPGIALFTGMTVAGPFSGDCYPASCGNIPAPTPSIAGCPTSSPLTGCTYGPAVTSVSFAVPTSPADTKACYRTDGVSPVVTTAGTCPAGSTTYTSGNISLTPNSLNQIRIVSTTATGGVTSSVATYYFNLVPVQNNPITYQLGWNLLKGSTVTMGSVTTYGTLNTCTPSISGNFGGGNGTLSRTTSGPCEVTLTVGNGGTSPTCTVTPIFPVVAGVTNSSGVVTSIHIYVAGSGLPASTTFAFTMGDGTHTATGTLTTNSSGAAISGAVTSGGSGFVASGETDLSHTTFPNYTAISSNVGFNVNLTSDDDPTAVAVFPIKVCANTTTVNVVPFYATRYKSQGIELQALTWGTSNPNTTWSITSQPVGASVTLPDTTNLTTWFPGGTVPGRYVIQACNTAEPTNCSHATVVVTNNALPYKVTPNGTEPIDPTADAFCSANGGTVYEVGPSQAHTTIASVIPTATSLNACDTIRIHNEGANGSPTTYNEWFQIGEISATIDKPIRIVGVPNASGELPVLEAINATTPSYTLESGLTNGVINLYHAGCFGSWGPGTSGSCGPYYIVIEGLRIQDARQPNTRINPDGVTVEPWVFDATSVSIHSGYGVAVRGIDSYNNANGFATYAPQNKGYQSTSAFVNFGGNRIQLFGNSTDDTEHGIYGQSFGEVFDLNNAINAVSTDGGHCFKTRSALFTIKYSHGDSSCQRFEDSVDIQDNSLFFNFEYYFCNGGNCSLPVGCLYNSFINCQPSGLPVNVQGMSADVMAGYTEALRNNWVVGNTITAQGGGISTFHYLEDHGSEANMIGTLHVIGNTVLNNFAAFNPGFSGAGDGGSFVEYPRFDPQNNIIDSPSANFATNIATFVGNFGVNLWRTGYPNITPVVNNCAHNGGTCGWGDVNPNSPFDWGPTNPVTGHVGNVDSSRFLFTPTQPVNGTTFVPVPGSLAINAGVAATGLAASFPVRLGYRYDLGYATLRQFPLTLGALDPSSIATSIVYGAKVYGGSIY